jgi:hypothetical protein
METRTGQGGRSQSTWLGIMRRGEGELKERERVRKIGGEILKD